MGDAESVYQDYRPDHTAPNLGYAFDEALSAASSLWTLAGEVESHAYDVSIDGALAMVLWLGPHRRSFASRLENLQPTSTSVAGSLRDLATAIGAQWAMARGQQDRVNFARYVHAQEEKRKEEDKGLGWEDLGDINPFDGGPDYGMPPENPDAPTGPGFRATRAPMYPEYGAYACY